MVTSCMGPSDVAIVVPPDFLTMHDLYSVTVAAQLYMEVEAQLYERRGSWKTFRSIHQLLKLVAGRCMVM